MLGKKNTYNLLPRRQKYKTLKTGTSSEYTITNFVTLGKSLYFALHSCVCLVLSKNDIILHTLSLSQECHGGQTRLH